MVTHGSAAICTADVVATCSYCRKRFVIRGSYLRERESRSKSGRVYCSAVCANKSQFTDRPVKPSRKIGVTFTVDPETFALIERYRSRHKNRTLPNLFSKALDELVAAAKLEDESSMKGVHCADADT